MEQKHTPEPWGDSHVKSRPTGAWVRMPRADYARARACVNALAGLNPDAVADVVKALEKLEDAASGVEADLDSERPVYESSLSDMREASRLARKALARLRE